MNDWSINKNQMLNIILNTLHFSMDNTSSMLSMKFSQ